MAPLFGKLNYWMGVDIDGVDGVDNPHTVDVASGHRMMLNLEGSLVG